MSSCESLCCIVLQQQPMHHFPISGKDCEQMVQWFLIDWSFVLEDGSSLCRTIYKVTCLMSAADGNVWLVLLCPLPALGHREVADGPGCCA